MRKSICSLLSFIILFFFLSGCSGSVETESISSLEKAFKNVVGETNYGNPWGKLETDIEDLKNYSINGISGTISLYDNTSLSSGNTFVTKLEWESTDVELPAAAYESLIKSVCKFLGEEYKNYSASTSEEKYCSIETNNYILDVEQDDSEKLILTFSSLKDHFNARERAALNAVGLLENRLKNPESLQIHTMVGSKFPTTYYGYAFGIDYSAQNSFGGYVRDEYYVYIDSSGIKEAYSIGNYGVEKELQSKPAVEIDCPITNIEYLWETPTSVIAEETSEETTEDQPSTTTTEAATTQTTTQTTTQPTTQNRQIIVKQSPNGDWYAYDGDAVATAFSGIANNEYGNWYISNGKVAFDYSGPVIIDGKTYTIDKGKVVSGVDTETTTSITNSSSGSGVKGSGKFV